MSGTVPTCIECGALHTGALPTCTTCEYRSLMRQRDKIERERDDLHTTLTTERQRADELQREVEEARKKLSRICCGWCRQEFDRDDVHGLYEHLMSCPENRMLVAWSRAARRAAAWHVSARGWRAEAKELDEQLTKTITEAMDRACEVTDHAAVSATGIERQHGEGQLRYFTRAIEEYAEARADSEHEARVGVEAALRDAASSLDAIAAAGTDDQPYLYDMTSVRGYAANRARVARTHLPAPQGGGD